MESHRGSLEAKLIDRSKDLAMVAIQGPESTRILPGAVEELQETETNKADDLEREK